MHTLRQTALDTLLQHQIGATHWEGRLSSSALSTALAAAALRNHAPQAATRATAWLIANQNPDGAWGDTPESPSNIPTTLITRATLRAATPTLLTAGAITRANAWLQARELPLDTPSLIRYIPTLYGQDKTFSAPIAAYLALQEETAHPADARTSWHAVPPLPYLLALFPRKLLPLLKLNVVSYALPALIAVGYCRHARNGGKIGHLLRAPLLRKLQELQPSTGGYLEAPPLTAFVALMLQALGQSHHPVTQNALRYLQNQQRSDGALPIDANLSQWLTALAIRAITAQPDSDATPLPIDLAPIARWMSHNALTTIHPFTGAQPGGFKWTHCPGGVPDADDTSAAIIAYTRILHRHPHLRSQYEPYLHAATRWLLDLQNRDGGLPAFCRGWGKLPFDKSCPDITAHALEALYALHHTLGHPLPQQAIARILRYLTDNQNPDGSWHPLWFGNQNTPGQANPIYGTSRVVTALRAIPDPDAETQQLLQRGLDYLTTAIPSNQEETALRALALRDPLLLVPLAHDIHNRGLTPAPIGLYFSALWYSEPLYPIIWTLEAANTLVTI